MYDAIIIGGGPAGLGAALILGRCRRRVLVCDSGEYRNAASLGLHGYLTRDGVPPAEFLSIAREQLTPYGVVCRAVRVVDAVRSGGRFVITLAGGDRLESRKLLIATGVVDHLPDIQGLAPLYGRSVFHCPYCHGWEMRDQPLAVYGCGKNALALTTTLLHWSRDVVLLSDGPAALRVVEREHLRVRGVPIRQDRITRLEGAAGVLSRVVFAGGDTLPRRGIFLSTRQHQRCELASKLGCNFTQKGAVRTNRLEGTNVPGLYVAGDASHDVQLAIVAAAEGAKAGFAIHTALAREEGK
jgi:thioredoxin reductase